MARQKTSPLEDFVDVVAMLPWWGGVILAAASYFFLHSYAGSPVTATMQPGQAGQMVGQQLFRALALFGQYLVPFLCLVAAAISASRRAKRTSLVRNAVLNTSADALEGISWQEFELLVGEAFRLKGFTVREQGGGGADGGVDLILQKNGETFLVQCKQWKALKVGVTVVRELYGVMAARGAIGGYVVTSGQFSQDAKEFAKGRNISLIDGPSLRALIASATTIGAVPRSTSPKSVSDSPACPKCGSEMIRRVAKSGANAGNAFWGCARFPACRGIRNMASN